MKKLIDMWFEAEEIALQFSQTKFYDIGAKLIKTLVLFVVCVIALTYLLMSSVVSFVMNCLNKVKKPKPKPIPQPPLASVMSEKYNEFGVPEDVSKKDGPISENDYENLRKVL